MTKDDHKELDLEVKMAIAAHEQTEEADREGLKHIKAIHDKGLYRAFGSMRKCISIKFPAMTRQWAYNKVVQVEVLANLEEIGVGYITENKAKLLKNYTADVQREIAAKAGNARLDTWRRIAATYASQMSPKARPKRKRASDPQPITKHDFSGEKDRKTTNGGSASKTAGANVTARTYRHRATIRYTTCDREAASIRLIEAMNASWSEFWPQNVGPTPNMTKVIGNNQEGSQDVVEIKFDSITALLGLLARWAEFFSVTSLSYQQEA
jgi:predicted ribonuclease toxin of YeeF-YezG toxin-antitoxin module